MFSATFPPQVERVAKQFMRQEKVWVCVGERGAFLDTVTQEVVDIHGAVETKNVVLVELLTEQEERHQANMDNTQVETKSTEMNSTIIFVNSKATAKWLDQCLALYGFKCAALHGDMSQRDRSAVLQRFSGSADAVAATGEDRVTILVATDVAARGLDIEAVKSVVNYDLPNDIETYTHRLGRTGRLGHGGQVTTFIRFADGICKDSLEVARALPAMFTQSNNRVPKWLANMAPREVPGLQFALSAADKMEQAKADISGFQ
jgi:superfamily II DNA/RNA helicase